MREKAFILTADALFALTAIGLLATAYAVLGSARPQATKYAALEQQGRDYLNLVYREGFDNFTAENFSQLTGHYCTGGCLGEKIWNFSRQQDALDWTTARGAWTMGGNTFSSTAAGYSIAFAGKQTWSNYNVSMRFFPAANLRASIGFHADTNGARFLCMYRKQGAGQETLRLWNKGIWSDTAFPPGGGLNFTTDFAGSTIIDGLWHTLNASIKGGNITCSIDDDPAMTITYDDPWEGMHRGWITLEANIPASFDNVSVLNIPQDPPYGSNFSMRSMLADYPWPCGCAPGNEWCNVSYGTSCLGGQDYNVSDYNLVYREAWVS